MLRMLLLLVVAGCGRVGFEDDQAPRNPVRSESPRPSGEPSMVEPAPTDEEDEAPAGSGGATPGLIPDPDPEPVAGGVMAPAPVGEETEETQGDAAMPEPEPEPDPDVDCDGGLLGPEGHCYLYVRTPASFFGSRRNCLNWGGDAVVIDDAEEEAFIVSELNVTADFWLGITDVEQEDVWLTFSGMPASYLPWDPPNPDGGLNAACARYYMANRGFRDYPCDGLYGVVCER